MIFLGKVSKIMKNMPFDVQFLFPPPHLIKKHYLKLNTPALPVR